ncbi:carbohydrate binding family 9 domain-containing protein [bacterium]|nr:carbohydrate binding family 9 domain-containing protein [bacterium]
MLSAAASPGKMRHRTLRAVCAIFTLSQLFSIPLFAQETKTVTAVKIDRPVKLDGFLSEEVWKNVEPLTDFTQLDPREGEPATEKTEVRVLFDDKSLYIGIICHDSEPDKIIHHELAWDGNITDDDSFIIGLDTFNDQRTGCYFGINPNGAQVDALVRGFKDTNDNWNAVWDVSARITDTGWQAEIEIPFQSLRFNKLEEQVWGINFIRNIRRKNEQVLWTSWHREDGPMQLSKAGKLLGLGNVMRGKQVDIKPYVLGGLEKERNENVDDVFKYGIDAKYPLTSNLTLDFTAKTDFAQVESDEEQINLTRFSLQYPEKRDFFLEGAEIFDFTEGGTKMYYSRRIGITPDPDRQQVPILGGMKLSGKAGPYQIGVMTMQTERKTVTTASGVDNVYPSTNYTVVRVKRDVLEQSYIGFIATTVERADAPDNPLTGVDRVDRFMNKKSNVMLGADFNYRTSSFMKNKNLVIQGYFAGSQTPDLNKDNIAGRLWVDYPNDTLDGSLLYHGIDNNFNPEIGFVSRPGIQQLSAVLNYTPRVNILHVKKLLFMPFDYTYLMDSNTRLLTRQLHTTPFGILFDSDDKIDFQFHEHYEWLDQDFNIFGDTVIPQGSYEYIHGFAEFVSSKSRRLSGSLSTSFGDHYDGTRYQYSGSCTYKINQNFAIGPSMEYTDITAGNSSFIARRYSTRFVANLSTRLSTNTFIQWNNSSRRMNLNFRIHYIPKIGSDVYVVYNQIWDEEDDYRTLQNTGILKVDYLFRF